MGNPDRDLHSAAPETIVHRPPVQRLHLDEVRGSPLPGSLAGIENRIDSSGVVLTNLPGEDSTSRHLPALNVGAASLRQERGEHHEAGVDQFRLGAGGP